MTSQLIRISMPARIKQFFLASALIALAPLCHAELATELYSMKAQAYINSEAAIDQLNTLKNTAVQQDLRAEQWYWLRLAEAQGIIVLLDDMQISLNAAANVIKQTENAEAQVQLLLLQGVLAQNNGALAESKTHFTNAIAQAMAADLKHLELRTRVELAYTYTLEDNFQDALETNHLAHMEARELGDIFITALAEDIYGAIYGYMDQYEESIAYYQKALAGYQQLGYQQYTSSAIFGIATSHRYWGKYQEALKYFHQHEQLLSHTTREGSKFYGYYGIATTLAAMNNCDAALPAINKAVNTEGPKDYKAELYKLQAKCYIKQQQLSEAETALNAAIDIFAQLPDLTDTNWQIETLLIAAKLAQANNNYPLAFALLSNYSEKKSRIDSATYSEKMIAYKATLENQQKDLKIKLLTENAKTQQLTANNQMRVNKLQKMLLIGLSLTVLIILAFVYILYKNLKRISELSIRDELTGLYNRRYIFNYLNNILSNEKEGKQFSIIIADIDNFKQINDNYGHPAGDSVIKAIAKLSLDTLRMTDVVGRIGGEEFLFILPRIPPKQCEEIVSRLLQAVREKAFTLPNGEVIHVTISMGICHNSADITDAKTIFHKADEALYVSKNNGKDQINSVENAALST
ncbi:GGDEF domain-containing protein [Dasania marina]|uniref:GGDEF domain-containing protein n=1 Tax=Dasania marina TaxID=471499 RepID=UPI00035E3EF8|nr:tetratricopeptide repeat-containing diguanylate cyclase [Dasania marina]